MANMIPAPGMVLRRVSFWLTVFTGVGDLVHTLLATLTDVHVLTATQLTIANSVLLFAAGVSMVVKQNIAMTADQKDAVIASVQAAPTKE